MKMKKLITMGLAAIMAVSVMSISAFAAERVPTLSEVDITTASEDNPVTYITEEGIKVTIFDPNISLSFSEIDPKTRESVPSTSIYINAPNVYGQGTDTEAFYAERNKIVKFGLSVWEGGPKYNVALYTEKGIRKVVAENVPKTEEATLDGTPSAGNYFFRVSTYHNAGMGRYYAYTL